MKRKILAVLGAALLSSVALVSLSAPAQAAPLYHLVQAVTSTPDDGTPPWARDTFTRTTDITRVDANTYRLAVTDAGTFTSPAGVTSPNSTATLAHAIPSGGFTGSFSFVVTGALKSAAQLAAVTPTFDYGSVTDKNNPDPALPTTGGWYKQYFADPTTTQGLYGWTWTYTTACESMTETEAGVTGNILGLTCTTPTAPTVTQPTCANPSQGVLHIPTIAGLVYKANGTTVTGDYGVLAGSNQLVTATADTGYTIPAGAIASWSIQIQPFVTPADCAPHPHVNVYPGTPRPTGNRAFVIPAHATWATVFAALHYPDSNIKAIQQWNRTHTVYLGGKRNQAAYSSWWNLTAGTIVAVPTISCGFLA